jgi:tetratricopeptide (TPR) repeat protein
VDQVHPRGVSGTFGLDAMEDAPRRAALCALAVHKAAQRSREETGHAPWSARAAIHVAEYHLDAGGLDAHVDRGGLEEAATTLTALLQGAEAGAVRVTRAAASFLERRFDLAALPEPAQGHRLTGRQHSGFGLSGRVTAFAGRLQELAVLESRLHSAVAGRGQVVAVIAEPGMGKSRLVAQFARGLDAHQAACFEGRCLSHASGIPFFPVAEIVRKVCGITDMDAAAVVVDKLRLVLETLGLAPSEQEPYLLQLLGVDVESARLRDVPPELMKVRTFEAVRQLALSANRQRALVLVLEDLHWIDKTSDEFLAGFVETIPGAPILLLLTYRPGYQAPWLARSYITQLALPALTIEESRLVLSSALDRAVVPAETVELLVARAEGNPFFLEELAQAVSEREDLGATVRVPDTIQGVLQARIDRLTRDDRRLLQTAAVIGRDVPFALLEAVAAEGPAVLRERLNRLQAAEFLHETRPSPHTMYFFKHALTQEVAYATLARQQQRDTHAQVARALRHVRPEVAEGRPEVVARHLTAADLFAEAAPHWLEAGRRAIARSANVEAVDHLQNAVQVLMQLPDVPARETRELELQLTLGPALIMTRGYAAPQVEAVYRRARELCDVIGDTPQLFTALWGISLFHTVRGDLRSARAMAERLLSVGVASADPDLLVEARLASGAARFHQGPLGEARAELEQAIALYDPDRHAAHGFVYGQDPLVAALGFLGRTLMLQGDEPAALACIERGLCRADAIDHAFSRAFALLNAGQLHELRGDFASVLAYAERGIELATEYRFPFFLGAALSLRGQVLVAEGRHFEGLGLILKGVGTWRETGAGLSLASYLGLIGDTYRLIGDFEQGMAAVAEGLEAAERGAEHISEPELHRVRGELLAAQPARSHEAGAAFETALALSARLGAPLFARRAAASLEAYLRARGRQAEAGEILARFLR